MQKIVPALLLTSMIYSYDDGINSDSRGYPEINAGFTF